MKKVISCTFPLRSIFVNAKKATSEAYCFYFNDDSLVQPKLKASADDHKLQVSMLMIKERADIPTIEEIDALKALSQKVAEKFSSHSLPQSQQGKAPKRVCCQAMLLLPMATEENQWLKQ